MSDEQRKYAEYPPGHPRHGISPTRPMQTMASRYCSPFVNPDLPVIHPETVDRRCPSPGCVLLAIRRRKPHRGGKWELQGPRARTA